MTQAKEGKPAEERPAPEPVNMVDGIPDRSEHPAVWKYVLIAMLFAAWVAFLVYCQIAGGLHP